MNILFCGNTWNQKASLISKRAFGILTEKQSTNCCKEELFAVGGISPQTYDYVGEVEVYDEASEVWKYHRNLPSNVLGLHGPDTGCIGATKDLVIFVGNVIIILDWESWETQVLANVSLASQSTKCSGRRNSKIKKCYSSFVNFSYSQRR